MLSLALVAACAAAPPSAPFAPAAAAAGIARLAADVSPAPTGAVFDADRATAVDSACDPDSAPFAPAAAAAGIARADVSAAPAAAFSAPDLRTHCSLMLLPQPASPAPTLPPLPFSTPIAPLLSCRQRSLVVLLAVQPHHDGR
jgi:hypothetical protein